MKVQEATNVTVRKNLANRSKLREIKDFVSLLNLLFISASCDKSTSNRFRWIHKKTVRTLRGEGGEGFVHVFPIYSSFNNHLHFKQESRRHKNGHPIETRDLILFDFLWTFPTTFALFPRISNQLHTADSLLQLVEGIVDSIQAATNFLSG